MKCAELMGPGQIPVRLKLQLKIASNLGQSQAPQLLKRAYVFVKFIKAAYKNWGKLKSG